MILHYFKFIINNVRHYNKEVGGENVGLLEQLTSLHLRQQYRKQERMMRNKLHPSTIGMCQRKIVFDMMMVPKVEPSDRLIRIFENGHAMHDRYQKLFLEMGILEEGEMKIRKGDISGSVDALIKVKNFNCPDGEEMLVELKSASEYSFKWMKENNTPKTEHRAQLQFYMHLSGVKKGIIMVENKDSQEIWEYPMEYDEAYASKLEQKALWCIDLAKGRKLPSIPKGHTPSNYKCGMCDYNFYCHYGSKKKNSEERYPIPFDFGTEAYFNVLDILQAIQNDQPIPDVIEGDTNGDLARDVVNKCRKQNPITLQELVDQYN